ncbi:MAG: TrkA C-terminal domain-containing protein [Halobacteriales archaeon]|nr:TrkA C-terminal domain-containing protein [Halobacteriales archaeon]
MAADDVEYEPVSVKAVLAEMKDTAELLIDLAYSAVLHGSEELAVEVIELEERMDVLQMRARMSLLLAARRPEDAEALAPVLGVVAAAEKISNAAGDIAKVVLEEMGLPEELRGALPEAHETVARATVAEGAAVADKALGDLHLETETGVRIIAIRRAGDWLFNPDDETKLRAGDVVLLRGLEASLGAVFERVAGRPFAPPTVGEPDLDDLERAVDSIVLMKNMSELAVDLAYGAVLFNSESVAEEVFALEAEVDALQSRFEAWTLRAAARVEDPISLRGLVRLATATEVISDAALELANGVMHGLAAHPVVAEAVGESDEVIVRLRVRAGSALESATLGERMVETETGMRVIAVRRAREEADDWIVSPRAKTQLSAEDVLIAKGTRAGAERLAGLAGDDADFDWT